MGKKVTISAISGSGEGHPLKPPGNIRTVFDDEAHLLGAASQSLSLAGIKGEAAERTGIVLGLDGPIDGWKEGYFRNVLKEGPIGASPLVFPYTSPNAVAARATIAFGLKGQAITLATGPLSFFKALAYASMLIECARLESALVGGVTNGKALTLVISGKGEIAIDAKEGFGPLTDLSAVSGMDETFALFEEAARSIKGSTGVKSIGARDSRGNYVTLGFSAA